MARLTSSDLLREAQLRTDREATSSQRQRQQPGVSHETADGERIVPRVAVGADDPGGGKEGRDKVRIMVTAMDVGFFSSNGTPGM